MSIMSCLLVGPCLWNIPRTHVIVLHGLRDFAMAYLTDIMILTASKEEHKQHIKKMIS